MAFIQWWVIKSLVKEYPNDADLGAEVRKYVHKVKEARNGKN